MAARGAGAFAPQAVSLVAWSLGALAKDFSAARLAWTSASLLSSLASPLFSLFSFCALYVPSLRSLCGLCAFALSLSAHRTIDPPPG